MQHCFMSGTQTADTWTYLLKYIADDTMKDRGLKERQNSPHTFKIRYAWLTVRDVDI